MDQSHAATLSRLASSWSRHPPDLWLTLCFFSLLGMCVLRSRNQFENPSSPPQKPGYKLTVRVGPQTYFPSCDCSREREREGGECVASPVTDAVHGGGCRRSNANRSATYLYLLAQMLHAARASSESSALPKIISYFVSPLLALLC